MRERLQKILARSGCGSRREIEGWIKNGRVKVNGVTAIIGDRVAGTESICLDGRPVRYHSGQLPRRVIIYHKPQGVICSRSDPQGRPTVFDKMPRLGQQRWVPVGRLDINTSGLMIFTTDGELAHRLMHPSYRIEREYAVRVLGRVSEDALHRLRTGVELEDGLAHFEDIIDAGGSGANHWYHVVLGEGRNHEVKRLWESQGITVSRLMRTRFGPIVLDSRLRSGQWMDLGAVETAALVKLVRLDPLPRERIDRGRVGKRDFRRQYIKARKKAE